MSKPNDEYNWLEYHAEYVGQLNELRKQGVDFFVQNITSKRVIEFHDNLHPNWKAIYTKAYELEPKTILEVGCGGCYHLKNLQRILPAARIFGIDLLKPQLEFGKIFSDLSAKISDNLYCTDFTETIPVEKHTSNQIAAEFVFTQAVIMHLNTEKARKFLRNLGKVSKRYIFMVEGFANHENFTAMVKEELPDFEFQLLTDHVDNAIFLWRNEI